MIDLSSTLKRPKRVKEEKKKEIHLIWKRSALFYSFFHRGEVVIKKKVPNDKLVLPKTRSETKSLNICNFFCQCTLVFHYLVKEGVSQNSCQNCIYNTTLVWLGFATAPDAGSCTPETPSSLSLTAVYFTYTSNFCPKSRIFDICKIQPTLICNK